MLPLVLVLLGKESVTLAMGMVRSGCRVPPIYLSRYSFHAVLSLGWMSRSVRGWVGLWDISPTFSGKGMEGHGGGE